MDTLAEKYEHEGCTVEIHWDNHAQDPWQNADMLGIFHHWHRRYDIGDGMIEGQHDEAMQRGGFKLLDRYLRLAEKALVVLPIGMYDHSGISIYVGGGEHWCDPGGWDSGTVGYVYTTRERFESLCGDVGYKPADYDGTPEEWLVHTLTQEIKTYDSYLTGEVYGYVVRDPDGETVDDCWGFIGDMEYVRQEANGQAEWFAAERQKNIEASYREHRVLAARRGVTA